MKDRAPQAEVSQSCTSRDSRTAMNSSKVQSGG